MLRKIFSFVAVVLMSGAFAYGQGNGILKGIVKDASNNEPIPFANVGIFNGGNQVLTTVSDIEGGYTLKPLPPGKYTVKATYVGYGTKQIDGVIISSDKTTYLDIPLTPTTQQLDQVEIVEYIEPLIDPDTKSGGTVTREEYQNMPSKNINSVASTTAGVFQEDEGGDINIRGSRSEGTDYYIDGQKVIGSSGLPQSSIEQVSVITGGVPAMYGDATGGIISISTRGPQSEFFGGVEGITSQFLDAYGYNFLGFTVGGPILSKKDSTGVKQSVIGYIVSGEYVNEKDDDPSAIGAYKVKDDILDKLNTTPLIISDVGFGTYKSSEFITMDSLEKIKYRQNVRSKSLRLNAKLDFRVSKNFTLTVGGSVDYNNRHSYIYEYALYNPSNNPQVITNTWRTFAKITQKFGSDEVSKDDKSTSNIKNAYYTLQVNYAQYKRTEQDDNHKDNLFDYGFIGKFKTYRQPIYLAQQNGNQIEYHLAGYLDTLVTFERDDRNEFGANYTSLVYDLLPGDPNNLDEIFLLGGLRNGDRPSNIYSLWYNTGRQYGGYNVTNTSQFSVRAHFSADIKSHAVQAGFEYEQRVDRYWGITPIGIWGLMRQLANFHLDQLDLANPIYNPYLSGTYPYYDYNYAINSSTQRYFDAQLREKLGLGAGEYIDIDSYDPGTFDISMFSADDLLNSGASIVNYYGYSHDGKPLKDKISFNDFFTKKDEDGNFTRSIDAYRPTYIAGYIQDKFDFKDIKFNVGVRVDLFDANQMVLSDKYLLYPAKTLSEVAGTLNPNGSHPTNMGDDYVVYVDNINPTTILGYRDGDDWYDASGNLLQDPSVIAGGSVTGTITPYLQDPSKSEIDATAFKDYQPKPTIMPRVAFSFPISDVANFFAHYDVLTQRPSSNNRMEILDYYFMTSNQGVVINNPDLKPERTTDYELGFSQTLSEKKNSAITISAFYRELRDMIQIVNVNYAYPMNYISYGNIDFGTVKGFSVAYDLRRSQGVQMTASYTLQFADGTGSSASGGYNLVSQGLPNLRTTMPLDFDQRHTIVANFDYRFGSGKNYRGPVYTKGKGTDKEKSVQWLKDVGMNVVFRAGSGLPYTKQGNVTQAAAFGIAQRSTLKGSVNGSYLPWNYRMDLRIDKSFERTFGKKKEGEDKGNPVNINVYLQVLNVLNTKNIQNVYAYTGNPDDDGFLASAEAQSTINAQVSPTSFIDLYGIKVNNPSNYSIPRRIRLGVALEF
ncbi:MAG: TonB-dependent receptor [Bacteroidia bacterium]|nr:TonB-dependent receptor [Bacteroidia bacterium]